MSTGSSKLPVRVSILPDESLTSWLVRLARANALRPQELISLAVQRKRLNLLARDLDMRFPALLCDGIAALSGVSVAALTSHELQQLMPNLVSFEQSESLARRWVLHRSGKTRRPTRPWTQLCVACLKEDAIPYIRRVWRLAFMTVCLRHSILLREACPHCFGPFNYASYDIGRPSPDYIVPASVCGECGLDVRNGVNAEVEVDRPIVAYERALLGTAHRGWTRVNGEGWVYSQRLFDVLFLLLGQLHSSKELQRLWRSGATNGVDIPSGRFEWWPLATRHAGMLWMEALLRNWPEQFLHQCIEKRVYSWALCSRSDPAPQWFHRVVRGQLHKPWHRPSPEEVQSVRSVINRVGLKDAHYTRRRLLGKWYPSRLGNQFGQSKAMQLQLFESVGMIGWMRLRGEMVIALALLLRAPLKLLIAGLLAGWKTHGLKH